MSKHQEILDYLEALPIGKRVSVRSISNRRFLMDCLWIKEAKILVETVEQLKAENRGLD